MHYVGRFSPSPTGPLHAGSLVAAMASYLDAKIHDGQWLLRVEDVDETRTVQGVAENIIDVLSRLGMRSDREIVWQSRRKHLYQASSEALSACTYACGCTRREIVDSRIGLAADGAAIYPGTCRHGLPPGRIGGALRVRVPDANDPARLIHFDDRWQGKVLLDLAAEAGDFVLRRSDGFWAYQLAVVVDDAEQGITHVVRGADLLYSTPRQIYLQKLLGYSTPHYLHVPVVRTADGDKLSKQNGAQSIEVAENDEKNALFVLLAAAQFLGLPMKSANSVEHFWCEAIPAWRLLIAQRDLKK